MPTNTRKALRRNKGSRNLTGNANRSANRRAQTFINQRITTNLTGNEIRFQASNLPSPMRNRIDRILNNMGM
jgi:hypothetical protein